MGRPRGTKRPTSSIRVLGRGMKQLCGICFRGGGVDGAAWGQLQHEERRGVLGWLVLISARRLPVGGSIGAWRPAHGTYWLVKGAEQLLDVRLVSGGFDWGSMRPGEARGESPAGVVVIPAETTLGACFRLLVECGKTH